MLIFVLQLLQKDPSKRFGSGPTGSDEVKCHKWFKPINWKKLEGREIRPSFCPEVAGQHCIANFDKRWTDMPLLDSPASSPNASGNPFQGFSYVRPADSFLQRNSSLFQDYVFMQGFQISLFHRLSSSKVVFF